MTRTQRYVGGAALLFAALFAAAAGWLLQRDHARAGSVAAPAERVSIVDGVTVVQIDPAVQRRSGIISEPAKAAGQAAQAMRAVPGVVVDLQPLLDWRGRVASARAQAQAAHAQWDTSQQELRRTQNLYADDRNASRKALESARSADAKDRAQAQSSDAALTALQEQGRQQFGPVLAEWAVNGRLEGLLARRDVVAAFATGDNPPRNIQLRTSAEQAEQGTWIAPAAQADAKLGAGLQLYRVPGPVPANAGIVGYVPEGGATSGVLVPLPAVVWHAGQPWAYVRRDGAHFARIWLKQAMETQGGFVVADAIKPGDQLVSQGAQLLLSQEQVPPPGAGGCKDPECD